MHFHVTDMRIKPTKRATVLISEIEFIVLAFHSRIHYFLFRFAATVSDSACTNFNKNECSNRMRCVNYSSNFQLKIQIHFRTKSICFDLEQPSATCSECHRLPTTGNAHLMVVHNSCNRIGFLRCLARTLRVSSHDKILCFTCRRMITSKCNYFQFHYFF